MIPQTITQIQKLESSYISFDVETTTSNFIADGVLIHNSSMTIYCNEGEYGVCSRNIDLKLEDTTNAFVKQFLALNLKFDEPVNVAIQGELIGEGINGNQYGLVGTDFYVFNIFNIDIQQYMPPHMVHAICKSLELKHVPVLSKCTKVSINQEELLEQANYLSILNQSQAEGIVYKSLDGKTSFKTISNSWLLKGND